MPTPSYADLQAAIEQLRPELPTLLGMDYAVFSEELDSYLSIGSINRVLDLFGRYPAAHNRLIDILDQPEEEISKGIRLPGHENIALPYLYYRCPSGPHLLKLQRAEKRDAAGRALCPQHRIAMSHISPDNLRTAIAQLRPEMPQLLSSHSSAFESELDDLLRNGSEDQLVQLFVEHPAACARLLELLA